MESDLTALSGHPNVRSVKIVSFDYGDSIGVEAIMTDGTLRRCRHKQGLQAAANVILQEIGA